MWQKKGKGIKYRGVYVRDSKGERNFVLVGIRKNGTVHTVTCESHEMAKAAGWKKVKTK